MRYYKIKDDRNLVNKIYIERNCLEKSKQFEDIIIEGQFSKDTIMTDYIKRKGVYQTNYLFSNKIKQVIYNYSKQLPIRAVVITDLEQNRQFLYWDILFKRIDCMISEDFSNDIILEEKKIKDSCLFTVCKNHLEDLIVRLDIAEQIMKIFPIGIKFYPVRIVS